jgi:hypothetical protein
MASPWMMCKMCDVVGHIYCINKRTGIHTEGYNVGPWTEGQGVRGAYRITRRQVGGDGFEYGGYLPLRGDI